MPDRRILVTGAQGQLGGDLVAVLSHKHDVVGVDIDEFDITDAPATAAAIKALSPQIVLHAAAYTDVDKAETEEDMAFRVNAEGAANVARACHEVGAFMLYYSTDYVFDGTPRHLLTEQDPPSPLNVYGRSKLAGERAIAETLGDYAIVRTAWLYGFHGRNFVRTILRLASELLRADVSSPRPWRVVDDQHGSPTWTCDVAHQTEAILQHGLTGIIHATSHGWTTWYHFAQQVLGRLGLAVTVEPCTTEDYSRPAPRPRWSVLSNRLLQQAGCDLMPPWEVAIDRFLSRHGKELLREVSH